MLITALLAVSVTAVATADPVQVRAAVSANRIFVTNIIASGPAEYDFLLGSVDAEILVGDWDGNGRDGFALRSGNEIDQYDERGSFIRSVTYGKSTDTKYRVGDWDGDGTDTLAVQRLNVFHITNSPTATGQFLSIGYGRRGDEVFVGDWDGDGIDTFAVRRKNEFFVRNSVTSGPADVTFGYGKVGDEVLVGDWDQDGTETFAVRRKNVIFIRNDFATGIAHAVIGYGKATDTLFVGDWNGDNVDTFAVRRVETTTPLPPVPSPTPANPGDTKDCGDFATWADANAWFQTFFPLYGDVANLDGNNDGVPCESLPGAP